MDEPAVTIAEAYHRFDDVGRLTDEIVARTVTELLSRLECAVLHDCSGHTEVRSA